MSYFIHFNVGKRAKSESTSFLFQLLKITDNEIIFKKLL